MKPSRCTRSGIDFNLLQPSALDVRLDDIAYGLAHTCRFAGQTRVFYSVAQHSVHVSQLAEDFALDLKLDPDQVNLLARIGLLHDAADAYLGGAADSLKQLIPAYQEIELGVLSAVFQAFGIAEGYAAALPAPVKRANAVMTNWEHRDFLPDTPWWLKAPLKGMEQLFAYPTHADAAQAFKARFDELFGRPPAIARAA